MAEPEEPATGAGDYGVAEPEMAATMPGPDTTMPVWYAARAGGPQVGPLRLTEVQRRIANRELLPDDLVWKGGMPGWAPARTVAELFPPPGGAQPTPEASVSQQPPPPPPSPGKAVADSWAKVRPQIEQAEAAFARPGFYRTIARVSAALAIVTLLVSLLIWRWLPTWFTGAVLFALIALVGESVAAVLEAIERVKSR
jgi:hypothetical protein